MTSTSGSSEVTAEKKTKTTPKRSASSRARKSTTTKAKPTKNATTKKAPAAKKKSPNTKRSTKSAKKTTTEIDSKNEHLVIPELTDELQEQELSNQSARKAPTGFAAHAATTVRRRRQVIIAACLLLIGIASSAAVGFTDVGRIDINQKIAERNERIKNNQATNEDLMAGSATLPVQNTNDKVDGGLIGLVGTTPPKPIAGTSTATSTASSSLATASSTASTTEPMTPQVAGASSSAAKMPEDLPATTNEESSLAQ